jgi:type IX secretion system PorP/SprF family membrane protein
MKRLLFALILLSTVQLYAQQDPLFSQYMFNKLAFNPAYAGSRDVLTMDVLYRNQWVDIDGAPKTISASVHSPLRNPHLAVGLTMYNDNIGPSVYQGAVGTFAYRILFPDSKLSFGIQAGFKHADIDWREINAADADDPLLVSQIKKKAVPDANFGVYYYSSRYYIGLSSKQLLQNQVIVVKNEAGKSEFTKLLAHFYGMAGVAIPVSENVVFRPSVLAKFVKNAPPQLDLNASFLFNELLWLGASYRSEKAISLITEFNITPNIRLGYSYDIWLNELKAYNKGSHEIRLGFDFNVLKNRMLTPRYF